MWTRAINMRRVGLAAILSILVLLVGMVAAGPVEEVHAQNAQSDYFLKIPGIEGESLDEAHRGEIDVQSWSWGETNSAHIRSSGLGAGKVVVNDFNFTMKSSKATPELFIVCAKGKPIPSATLTGTKDGHTFLTWELKNVIITSFKTRVEEGSGTPTDEVRIAFEQIVMTYMVQNSDGTTSVVKAGYDVIANKKL